MHDFWNISTVVFKIFRRGCTTRFNYDYYVKLIDSINGNYYIQVEANYDWEYAVNDKHYVDFGHKESRHGYAATGKYYVALPDGRFQTVTYVADENGYKPVVDYNGDH